MAKKATWEQTLKATRFMVICSFILAHRKGLTDYSEMLYSLVMLGEIFAPDWHTKLQGNNLEVRDDSKIVYLGLPEGLVDSKLAQDQFKLWETWEATDLIYKMRDAMIVLTANPLDSYKGDFRNTTLYELWLEYSGGESKGWLGGLFQSKKPRKIILYTISDCSFSDQARKYLKSQHIVFEERNLEQNRNWLSEMLAASNGFVGTPVLHVIKYNGQSVVAKGFTKSEYDKALR